MSTLAAPAPLKVVQITDCHLPERPGTPQLNIDTDHSLLAVLGLLRRRPAFDLLLATGDLSENGSTASYHRLRDYTREFGEARWLPGNHDSADSLRAALAADARLERTFDSSHWRIILLDTAVPGAVGGCLADRELAALEACLAAAPDRHALICVHHPVVAIGCNWLDEQRVANADAFWAVVGRYPQVRGVLSGHVHQVGEHWVQGVRVLTTPSTAWQFAVGSADFQVDHLAPGYRWLDLHADGTIETGVERVAAGLFAADLDSEGY